MFGVLSRRPRSIRRIGAAVFGGCRIQIERLPHSRLRWRRVSDNSNGVILAAAVRTKTDARPPSAGFFSLRGLSRTCNAWLLDTNA